MKNILIIALIILIPSASAAHYIVGQANDAIDGTSANGHTVLIWNPVVGIDDNISDIVGPTGNSGTDNVYFVDCEALNSPCQIGDVIYAKILDAGDSYKSGIMNLTVTGAGYDVMPDLNLTAEILIYNISVDDSNPTPIKEIDLTPASTTNVMCTGVVEGNSMDILLNNVTSEFFSTSSSFYGDSDKNYKHYTNSSCQLNTSFGNSNQVYFNCTYQVQYYATNGNWNCTVNATKNITITKKGSTNTTINTLLALGLPDTINYGTNNITTVSSEVQVNITNYGNVGMNLSLEGYAKSEGDNNSMNCTSGAKIAVYNEKYNLTASTPGNLDLPSFQNSYFNLTSVSTVRNISLDSRKSDLINDAFRSTYWRIYTPSGVAGSCSGEIIFGAVSAPGS